VQRFGTEWLPQLVEALPIGVFILDADGTAVYANAAAQVLLGRAIAEGDRAENLRERYAAYVAGTNELYPTMRMPIVRALAGERVHVDDMEVDRNGTRVALDVTATPIFDEENRVAFAVAVFQDITAKRKASEELEQRVASRTHDLELALRAKSAFLMNVSHELRTPLNHIIGFNQLLAERIEDDRSRKLAASAQSSGEQLLGIIDDLIELARAESGSVDHALVPFDFDTLLSEVAREANVAHDHHSVGVVHSDPRIVSQALRVLLARATADAMLSATRDGSGVRITIESAPLARRLVEDADIGLAVARARLRAIGGDVVSSSANCVELLLPRLEQVHDVRDHEQS